MNKYLMGILMSVASVGGSMYAMEVTAVVKEKRLNKEQFDVLKKLICDEVVKGFVEEMEETFPRTFEDGMPDYMFKDLDGEALKWIVDHADTIIKIRDKGDYQAKDALSHDLDMLILSHDTKKVGCIIYAASYLAIQPVLDTMKHLFGNPTRITADLMQLAFEFKDIKFCDYSQLLIGLAGANRSFLKLDVIKLLLDPRLKVDLNASDELGHTALTNAIDKNHCDVVKLLIEAGADPSARGVYNGKLQSAPIFCAMYEHRLWILRYLLQNGADVDAQDTRGNTVLLWVIKDGKAELAEELIRKGFNVNATNNDGSTALMLAVGKGNEELVKKLLEKGAKVNAVDSRQISALFYAARHGTPGIVKLLLDAGANASQKDKWGKTALDVAKERKDEHRDEIEKLFEKPNN